ncbi:MAG: hypothetical protein P8170_17530, partial [Gemmatimonadota bacterium]
RRLAWAEYYRGSVELALGNTDAATDRFAAALAIADSLAALDPTNQSVARSQVNFRARRAQAHSLAGRHREALGDFARAVQEAEALVRRSPDNPQYTGTLGWAHMEHALALVRAGRPRMALQEADRAEELLSPQAEADRETRYQLAWAGLARGASLEALGRGAEATAAREGALTLLEDLVGQPGGEEFRPGLADALLALDHRAAAEAELRILRTQGYRQPFLSAPPSGTDP